MTNYCRIEYSKDGSHNYVAPTFHELGDVGAFQKTVIRRRMGMAREIVVQVSVSSPIKAPLIAAAIQADSEQ